MDKYNFYVGKEFFAQDWLGAHVADGGTYFRTFAPAADGIVVAGDSGEWEMHKVLDGNFWEAFAPGVDYGEHYYYRIYHGGAMQEHCDPYGFAMGLRPDWHSIVCDLSYDWHDGEWMDRRRVAGAAATYGEPMNIYEMNLGSWHKKSGDKVSDDPADWYTYSELAVTLPSYLRESGFNWVEFMPLAEYPFDGSWGYQPTGFFAATSRYGTPIQLMKLVDALHQAGIGVLLDFVPVHFATDAYGLADYDGTPLFEYPNDAVGVSEWGSHNFMHSRGETCSFLQSAANFWVGAYHLDGLRLDAISRIIYWQGEEARGVNGNAVDFMRTFTSGVRSLNPGSIMVAEDSTDFDGTTRSVDQGGLGFDYKWDMGWMHDTLELFQLEPAHRPGNYHKLSFSMMYFRNERYLMPLSHDEVVHGKATVLQKMHGDYEEKFPQGRTLYMYMMVHPGKKLNFMGSEIGQLREWDENREQDWFLRDYPMHDSFYRYCCDLNHLYLEHPALWSEDYENDGFVWRQVSDTDRSTYAIERRGCAGFASTGGAGSSCESQPYSLDGGDTFGGSGTAYSDVAQPDRVGTNRDHLGAARERLLCVLNLSDQPWPAYEVDAPDATSAVELLNTDWDTYAGKTPTPERYASKEGASSETSSAEALPIADGRLTLDLPPYSGRLFLLK